MKQFLLLLFISTSYTLIGQVQWLSLEEAEIANKETPKKMLLFFETDWCGYCKMMKTQILNEEKISDFLNENYYSVKVNAEQKQPITFNGQTYEYAKQGRRGANQFAIDMLQGRLAYPSVVFLENDLEVISLFQGMQPKDLFQKYLQYLKEDAHNTKDWFEYSNQKE